MLCNLSTLEAKGKKKPAKNQPAYGCWQPADLPSVCTSVACRRSQSPRPVSADDLLSLVGGDVTPPHDVARSSAAVGEEGASSKWRLQRGRDAVVAAAGLSDGQYQL